MSAKQLLARLAARRGLSSASGSAGPLERMQQRVRAGELREDPQQLAALQRLARLHSELLTYAPPPLPPPPAAFQSSTWRGPRFDAYGTPVAGGTMFTGVANDSAADGAGAGLWGRLGAMFGGGGGAAATSAGAQCNLSEVSAPLGVYLYGGPGCGKSLMMDTFFESCGFLEKRRRLHFNEFMLDVHRRMHELRQAHPESGDPLPLVAHGIAESTQLLCFDEFQVTDVADALVMRRLFRLLFGYGLVMVATSNRAPTELYKNGIQRDSFVPFIDDLRLRCEVHDLESEIDYRMLSFVASGARTYLHPLGEATASTIDETFAQLTKGGKAVPQTLRLRGREVHVPLAGVEAAVARFSFLDLCGKALGAEDYLGLATAFHTVIVEGAPQLTLNEINQVRRFITMVDMLYDKRVRLIITAAVPMEHLFSPNGKAHGSDSAVSGTGLSDQRGDLIGTSAYVPNAGDEVFAFERTLSRLREMSSHEYLIRSVRSHERASFKTEHLVFETDSELSHQEALELFRAFDVDASGVLDKAEVRLLLQEVSERRKGHRNVLEEEVEAAFRLLDQDGDGEVSQYEFIEVFADSALSNVKVLQFGDALPELHPPKRARAGRVSRAAEPFE